MASITCRTVLLLATVSYIHAEYRTVKKFLVLGGNGLMGSELVSLLNIQPATDITIVNRGNWYWDSYHRIKPFVTHVKCDRFIIHDCTQLKKVAESKFFFDVVFDFSSYQAKQLRDFLDLMRHRIGRYVYISSDSVYEVSQLPPNFNGEPSREEDAVRPASRTRQEELRLVDGYGHNKLECEEVLEDEHALTKLPYISLRIPDVIGPRDNTDRFWFYFIWVKFQDVLKRPVNYPPYLQGRKLSFVFSEDVAILMNHLPYLPDNVFNQAYNLACKEMVTLEEFIKLLGEHVGVPDVQFDKVEERGATYFPSVQRGPLNITKAEKMLPWKPTALSRVIKKTAEFYSYAMFATEFKMQRDGTIKAFVPDEVMDKFHKKYQQIYGQELKIKRFPDEL
ncbi:uncharacterized protein LOC5518064 [Nematostella vectensis]|uniref:uncharacterized protein LOC5518064 n=1 Tax=Nematostella vectensis TaxID=45351 RepID=UPI00139005E2|nr:uncharacterized protein LOC5518064 [Nematostella vectensis]